MPTDAPNDEGTTTDTTVSQAELDKGFAEAIDAGLEGKELPEPADTASSDGEALTDETDDARDEAAATDTPGDDAGDDASTTDKDDDGEKAKAAADADPDDIDAPLDDGVDERTAKRFETLRESYKAERDARAASDKRFDELAREIRGTGASTEEYAATLDFLALRNSGDPDRMREAYDLAVAQVAQLGQALGVAWRRRCARSAR